MHVKTKTIALMLPVKARARSSAAIVVCAVAALTAPGLSQAAQKYSITDLGAGASIILYDVNNTDQVVGSYIVYDNHGSGLDRAFLWQAASRVDMYGGA